MQFNARAQAHFNWVDRMGWHTKSTLESLALVASEIGETFDECSGATATPAFEEELTDIALRVMDLLQGLNVNIDLQLESVELTWPLNLSLHSALGQLTVDLAKCVNACRGDSPTPALTINLAVMLARVVAIAEGRGIDLASQVDRKMAINEQRGSRGRKI